MKKLLIIGLATVGLFWGCSSEGTESGIISHTFVSTVGVFFGALVSALLSQEFKIRTPKETKRYVQSLSGGILMGYSAGLGFSSYTFDDGTSISCLVAVNALGSIVDPENGKIIAGPKKNGKIYDSLDLYINGKPEKRGFQNTTIGAIFTNSKISKVDCKRLAVAAHDGLALSVRPSHTSNDGDLFFAATTNEIESKLSIDQLFAATIKVTYQAIINAIKTSD